MGHKGKRVISMENSNSTVFRNKMKIGEDNRLVHKESKIVLVSPFHTVEQEKQFAKIAEERMNQEARLHWNEDGDIESTNSNGRTSKNGMSEEDYLISKMNNVLTGDAMSTKDDFSMSPEEKTKRLQAIERLKHYIENYEQNMELIRQAKEYNLRIEDDGR